MAFYIDVEDLASYRKKITDAGGKILVEEQEVPEMGVVLAVRRSGRAGAGKIWKQAACRTLGAVLAGRTRVARYQSCPGAS